MPPQGYRKPVRDQRSKQFTFWVTPAEKQQIHEIARRVGLTPSAYVRAVALGARPRQKPGHDLRELVHQLARVGNNLDQLRNIAERDGRASVPAIDAARVVVQRSLKDLATAGNGRVVAPDKARDIAHHGTTINALAHSANRRRFPSQSDLKAGLAAIVAAVRAL